MDRLFLKIEEAEQIHDESIAYSDALCDLSKNPVATSALAQAMKQAAVNAEIKWRAIEQLPEFRARYSDRDAARADFLREVWKD